MLSMRKLAPTPDNYHRCYDEIAGVPAQYAGDPLEPLLATLRELPRSDPDLKEPAARLQRALVSRNWKTFGSEILALRERAGHPDRAGVVPVVRAGGASARAGADPQGPDAWPDTIRDLITQFEQRHEAVSPREKRDGLERVLGGFGRSPLLQDRLRGLIQSWGTAQGAGAGIDPAPADATADRSSGAHAPHAVAALPSAGTGQASLDIGDALVLSASTLRQLLADVLRNEVAPRLATAPVLASDLNLLSALASTADSTQACVELTARLDAFWASASQVCSLEGAPLPDLMGLVRLLVECIVDRVEDAPGTGDQVDTKHPALMPPLAQLMLSEAQLRLRERVQRQGTIERSLAAAKTTLKDMVSIFIERLGEMSDSTAAYHEKIGIYAERIEGIEDMGSLKDVLDGLMGDMRSMQSDALRSRDEVVAAREHAEAAESRIRQLETELEEIGEKVREDALTGSLNRRGLDEALSREAARAQRYGNAFCVSVIDLDNFKMLNDTHGHHAGDEALVHLVKVVKALLRPTDDIGRFGGEEFVILLPETTLEAGKMAIERLQRELTKQFFLANNEKLLITFSAGVAQLRPGEPEADLVRRADQAMYRAKQSGKNRVFVAD
jgi:diguanylate cyclase